MDLRFTIRGASSFFSGSIVIEKILPEANKKPHSINIVH